MVKLYERTRVPPVPESKAVAKGITTKHDDKGEDQEANDQQHLAQGGPKFDLPVPPDSEDVDEAGQSAISLQEQEKRVLTRRAQQ